MSISGTDRLPTSPAPFPQLLRGPRFRWWKPLLSLLLFLGLAGAVQVIFALVGVIMTVARVGQGTLEALAKGDVSDPVAMTILDLVLAGFIPAGILASWIVYRVSPGYLFSVVGRLRWRWLVRCFATLLPVWAVYVGLETYLAPPESGRPDHWIVLVVLAVILTPLQCAGEEMAFRGWLTQNVAAYFRHPLVGFVVAAGVSSATFALVHGSLHIWVLLDLGIFALSASYLNWRTGGLEAGIAVHCVNNMSLFLVSAVVGGYTDGIVKADTTGSPIAAGITLLVQLIAVGLIELQIRRVRPQRLFRPASAPAVWIAPLGWADPADGARTYA